MRLQLPAWAPQLDLLFVWRKVRRVKRKRERRVHFSTHSNRKANVSQNMDVFILTKANPHSTRFILTQLHINQTVLFSDSYFGTLPLFGTNLSELLNIQNREIPSSGPSLTNSWPSPLPHFPQSTWTPLPQHYTIEVRRDTDFGVNNPIKGQL